MEIARHGFDDVQLMEGERIDSSITLALGGEKDESPEVLLLTDSRVIHLNGTGKRRTAVFASVDDISTVEIFSERAGLGVYVWSGLSFIVALLLWRVIDNPIGSVASGIIVALMGVYLIADHLMSAGTSVATFKTSSSQFKVELKGEGDSYENVYFFINRLFRMKQSGSKGAQDPGKFAPR
ncbi:MAG: hypothetical protein IH861_14030 [Chloroflexi bacterium]|nr:hypothetical protein [Chloroflexota bacterium]